MVEKLECLQMPYLLEARCGTRTLSVPEIGAFGFIRLLFSNKLVTGTMKTSTRGSIYVVIQSCNTSLLKLYGERYNNNENLRNDVEIVTETVEMLISEYPIPEL